MVPFERQESRAYACVLWAIFTSFLNPVSHLLHCELTHFRGRHEEQLATGRRKRARTLIAKVVIDDPDLVRSCTFRSK